MRTVTKTFRIFSLKELSEEAKAKAYADWQNNQDSDWDYEYWQTLEQFCKIFRVRLQELTLSPDFFDIKTQYLYDEDITEIKGGRLVAYLVNWFWHKLHTPKMYHSKSRKRRRESRIFWTKDCLLERYATGLAILRPMREFMEKGDPELTFSQLLEQCFNSFGMHWQEKLKEMTSLERFERQSEEQGREYLPDGTLYN